MGVAEFSAKPGTGSFLPFHAKTSTVAPVIEAYSSTSISGPSCTLQEPPFGPMLLGTLPALIPGPGRSRLSLDGLLLSKHR